MLKTVSFLGLTGQLNYAGTWNASSNSPTLTSGVGTKNTYYIVSTAGSTNLDGITTWNVGDWAIFNGTVWERILGGTTESFANVTVTGTANIATGNVTNLYSGNAQITAGNITANLTGSTIPVANVVGAVANTVTITASGLLSGGGNLASNVTISLSNVPAANITGLGTMATQNASSVVITGGTINSVTENGGTYTNVAINSGNATLTNVSAGNVAVTFNNASRSVGALAVGGNIGGGPDTGIMGSFVGNSTTYAYVIIQNTNNTNTAYTTFTLANEAYTAYANLGINNSTFAQGQNGNPNNSISAPNAAYFYNHNGDVVIGTWGANTVHFIGNASSVTSDAMTINGNNTVTINSLAQSTSSTATMSSSMMLAPAGYLQFTLANSTVVKVPYYAV